MASTNLETVKVSFDKKNLKTQKEDSYEQDPPLTCHRWTLFEGQCYSTSMVANRMVTNQNHSGSRSIFK